MERGVIEAGGGTSDAALMRRELVRVWGMVGLLTDFLTALMEEAGGAITGLVVERDGVRIQLHSQNEEIKSLEQRLAIQTSWNCRTSDNPEHYAALLDYREASRRYQAGLVAKPASDPTISGMLEDARPEEARPEEARPEEARPEGPKREGSEEPMPEGATPEGPRPEKTEGQEGVAHEEPATDKPATAEPQETRRQFQRKMAAHQNGAEPRNAGGQPNHKGRSRNTKPDKTVSLRPELCMVCGTVPNKQVKILRIRMYDLDEEKRRKLTCTMCMIFIMECSMCSAKNRPDTDLVIPGTSFGPMLRGMVTSYHDAHVVEEDMKKLLKDLEKADFSKGTISNCVSAVAADVNAPPICLPYEEPIVLSEDLREYRSPIKPRSVGDSDYEKQEVALTCYTNLWTSFTSQPIMVQVLERASMDPHAATDETPNRIGKERVQTLVSVSPHTVRIHVVPHRDAGALRRKHYWMVNRHGMRDGTKGFEWHRRACCRCCVHVLRKSEDFAMKAGIGSWEYTRHVMLQEVYHDLKLLGEDIERRAGGPIRCASQLGKIYKVPGLLDFIRVNQAIIIDRLIAIRDGFPRDGFTTTLDNAIYDMVRAAEVPGMLFQNNPTEGEIRDEVTPDKRRYHFPNDKAAQNHSIIRSFTATCRRNGISPFDAMAERGKDRRFDIFNAGIPPPIFGGGPS